jgi:hypothetical protein
MSNFISIVNDPSPRPISPLKCPVHRVDRSHNICTSPVPDLENQLSEKENKHNIQKLSDKITNVNDLICKFKKIISKEKTVKENITGNIKGFTKSEGDELSLKIQAKNDKIQTLETKVNDLMKYSEALESEFILLMTFQKFEEEIQTLKILDFKYDTKNPPYGIVKLDSKLSAYETIRKMYEYLIKFYNDHYKIATIEGRKSLFDAFKNDFEDIETNINYYKQHTLPVNEMKEPRVEKENFEELLKSATDSINKLRDSPLVGERTMYCKLEEDYLTLYELYDKYEQIPDEDKKREFYIQKILTPITHYEHDVQSTINSTRSNNDPNAPPSMNHGGKKKTKRKTKRKQRANNKKTKKVKKTKKAGKKSRKSKKK